MPIGGLPVFGRPRVAACAATCAALRISNGLCMSPDGSRLYFADSPTRTIRVFELIEPDGTLGPSPGVRANADRARHPDGAAVDADGCIWSAHWGARLRRALHARRPDRPYHARAGAPADLRLFCAARISTSFASRSAARRTRPRRRCGPSRTPAMYSCTGLACSGLREPEYQP